MSKKRKKMFYRIDLVMRDPHLHVKVDVSVLVVLWCSLLLGERERERTHSKTKGINFKKLGRFVINGSYEKCLKTV